MKDKSLNREKERLRRRLDNSGFVRAIGWNDNENMITGWTSFTVTLFFLNGHLPEVQQRVCGCVREYASLIGKEAKFYMSPVSSRLHLAKNGRIKLLTENDIRKVREKGGRRTVKFLMASHETMEEYNTRPPKFSLFVSLQLDIEDSEDEIPPERKVSMISAVFPPSFFLIDKQPLTFTDLVLKWSNALHPLSGTEVEQRPASPQRNRRLGNQPAFRRVQFSCCPGHLRPGAAALSRTGTAAFACHARRYPAV